MSEKGKKNHYDMVVIGSGPAGQKAAVQAAKIGRKVALIERDRYVGGACVHRGTIPSKTLRESALHLSHLRKDTELFSFTLKENVEMEALISRMDEVVSAHDEYINAQLARNHVEYIHGRGKFLDKNTVKVTHIAGEEEIFTADYFVISTGSHPRMPGNIPIDHEHVFDSDSILSMLYLPRSLIVLGGGVIASEYGSIFASLGVCVTMIDRYERPLGFLDPELTDRFVSAFSSMGGEFIGGSNVVSVKWNDVSKVVVTLDTGEEFMAEKLLCAAGRIANVSGLGIENIGVELADGLIPVDNNYCTSAGNIYAAGDVIGPPSLASVSMEQGRRATCHAFGIDLGDMVPQMPMGIYSIPEISSVGYTEEMANKEFGGSIVGIAKFEEIARGQIAGIQDGMLKLVADDKGDKLLGIQVIGEGATELIHIGQMGLISGVSIDMFIESIFNFPTLAEAYRVAALAIKGKRGG